MASIFDEAPTSQESFARLLRFFRVRAGLSQVDLATMAQLSARTISDLERGVRRRAYLPTVQALAVALALTQEERDLFASTVQRARIRRSQRQSSDASRLTDPPRPPSPFIGRESELAGLVGCISTGLCRLVSITGAPGAGKSRLAIEAGRALMTDHAFRVHYVDLAAEPASWQDVASFTAHRFGGEDGPPPVLLVIDNLEQLGADARELPVLVEQRPWLHVLATTKVAGLIPGEHEVHLDPLPLPDDDVPESVLASPAVQMLASRYPNQAELMTSSLAAPALAVIARRLDGLPLAIRTFAGHTQRQDIVGSMHESVRAVHASTETSYNLLPAADQWAFRRLALFPGAWTLDDAADYLMSGSQADGGALSARQVYATLHRIAQHGLLQVEAGPHAVRFRMLGMIRDYALGRLDAAGESESARETIVSCALHLGSHAQTGANELDTYSWRRRLIQREATVEAALDECLRSEDCETMARLLWSLRQAIVDGIFPSVERRVAPAAGAGGLSPADEGKLLVLAACLRAKQGYGATGCRYARRGLELLALAPWDRIEALQLLPPSLTTLVENAQGTARRRA